MSEQFRKFAAIINSLHKKTELNEIKWEVHSFSGQPYCVLTSTRSIYLDTFEYQGEPFEKVTIRNTESNAEVSFTDADIPRSAQAEPSFDGWYALMRGLRERASRQAMGLDTIFDDVMRDLGAQLEDDDEIPF